MINKPLCEDPCQLSQLLRKFREEPLPRVVTYKADKAESKTKTL